MLSAPYFWAGVVAGVFGLIAFVAIGMGVLWWFMGEPPSDLEKPDDE